MIIRKIDDYFLIKFYRENIGDFNIFDSEDIKELFQDIFKQLKDKYNLNGLIDVDVYVNFNYGMIIEIHPIYDFFDGIDIKIHIHLDSVFLSVINSNNILDYNEVYYYNGKFYGTYLGLCDNEVLYKDTSDIINNGIKVC